MVDLSRMSTEQINPNTTELSSMSIREAIEVINRENYNAVSCIEPQYEMLERVIEITSQVLEQGGRIIYMGAGTSGRIGLLDAVECPPTFGVDYNTVIGLIAGGDNAFVKAVEGAEDSPELGAEDLKKIGLSEKDVVIGLAASGRTPYVIGGRILEPENSTREWSGEVFWNEDWNKDIDFSEAFRTSCVWYYRQVIDDIGKDRMKRELNKLQYGNCDISDWEGRLNTNNNNRALTGFWIESSLLISPKEQVEVMERIFGENADYSEETQNELKQVMRVSGEDEADIPIYGKTGMGKAEGIVVDAWFTGFAEGAEGNLYFCVRLGRSDGMKVSSSLAKEIAVHIVSDYKRR